MENNIESFESWHEIKSVLVFKWLTFGLLMAASQLNDTYPAFM